MAEQGYSSGAFWSMLNAAARVCLPLAIFVYFARVLSPAEIGAVALALACSEFVKTLGLPGVYEVLLQQKGDADRRHETAFAVLTGAGLILFCVYFAVFTLIGNVVDGVALHPALVGVIGLRIVFDLAILQPQARLAQRLVYRRFAMRAVYGHVAAGAAGIAVADLLDHPMAGFVAYQAGQSATMFLLTVLGTGALATPRFHRDAARSMARETGMSSALYVLRAATDYLDQVAVAAMFGGSRMAFFNLAKRGEGAFLTVASSFASVLFQPLFARHGAEDQRREAVRRGLAVLTLACGLPAAVFATNSEAVVVAVFGPAWAEAAPVAAALAVGGVARALAYVHGALLSVTGRNGPLLVWSAVSAATGIILVLATAPFGLVLCAWALVAKSVLALIWLAALTRSDAPNPGRVYALEVIAPFGLMLAGAAAGHWIALAALTRAPSALEEVLALALSGGMGAACGLAYFAIRFPRVLLAFSRSAPVQRAREA
jgi:teichuronic acid exporter